MKKFITILSLSLFILSGCATPAAPETPTAVPTRESGVVVDDLTLLWKGIRDEQTGYGLAIPCWWQVKSIPVETEGNLSSIVIRNFDDNFFKTYSENGDWIGGTPPQGVIVISVTAAKTSPDLNSEESYLQYTRPGSVEVTASQDRKIGEVTYTLVTIESTTDASLPALTVFINRLSPDSVLIVNAYPPEAIIAKDFYAILSSLVGEGEEISLPSVAPEEGLINAACPY